MPFTDEQLEAVARHVPSDLIESREAGRGQQVSYIPAWAAIDQTNKTVGYHAWDRETVELVECYAGPAKKKTGGYQNKPVVETDIYRAVYRAKVRITVRTPDGEVIVREGTGVGDGECPMPFGNPKDAYELAVKEAESDAMKRALVTFGNAWGLHLYDKKASSRKPQQQRPPQRPAPQQTAPAQRPALAQPATPAANFPLADAFLADHSHLDGTPVERKALGSLADDKAQQTATEWCKARSVEMAAGDGAAAYGVIKAHAADLATLASFNESFAKVLIARAAKRIGETVLPQAA